MSSFGNIRETAIGVKIQVLHVSKVSKQHKPSSGFACPWVQLWVLRLLALTPQRHQVGILQLSILEMLRRMRCQPIFIPDNEKISVTSWTCSKLTIKRTEQPYFVGYPVSEVALFSLLSTLRALSMLQKFLYWHLKVFLIVAHCHCR